MIGKISRIISIFCWCLLISFVSTAQNICPNPGFEQISSCPTGPGELTLASPWTDAGSPSDLFNFCYVNGTPASCSDVNVPTNFAGTSSAFAGSSYAGFYTKRAAGNKRTYLQAPLTAPMVNGQLYRVSANFRRSSASKYATNRIGISFSTSVLSQTAGNYLGITPQIEIQSVIADTSMWTPYTDFYVAAGGEAYITIGNFRGDAGTTSFGFNTPVAPCTEMNSAAFYYTDGIEVVPITEILSVSGDTTICIGDSTKLTGNTNTSGWWSLLSMPNDTLPAINNSITVMPVDTTTYVWNGISSSVNITVYTSPAPVVNLISDTTVCQSNSVTLDAGNDGTTYLWSNGETTSSIMVSDSGSYIVTVSNGYCSTIDTSKIHVLITPAVTLPLTQTICPDNNEVINLNAGAGDSYAWLPGGDTTQVISVTEPGPYAVTVTHANGCTRTGATDVEEVCAPTLYFPGAFTPNKDGKNDLFFGLGTNYNDFNIKIFNRWGQLVFESDFPGEAGGWNGKYNGTDAPAGLYVYYVSYSTDRAGGKKKLEKEQGYFILWR